MTRTATPLNSLQPFGPASRTETRVLNGRTTRETFNATTRTLTLTSPQNRVTTSSRNASGTLLQMTPPGRATQRTLLDAQGRVTSITFDDGTSQRTTTFAYDPVSGYLSSKTGPISGDEYDANGNRSVLEQSGATLTGSYDGQVRLISYGPHQYTYSAVGALNRTARPERLRPTTMIRREICAASSCRMVVVSNTRSMRAIVVSESE